MALVQRWFCFGLVFLTENTSRWTHCCFWSFVWNSLLSSSVQLKKSFEQFWPQVTSCEIPFDLSWAFLLGHMTWMFQHFSRWDHSCWVSGDLFVDDFGVFSHRCSQGDFFCVAPPKNVWHEMTTQFFNNGHSADWNDWIVVEKSYLCCNMFCAQDGCKNHHLKHQVGWGPWRLICYWNVLFYMWALVLLVVSAWRAGFAHCPDKDNVRNASCAPADHAVLLQTTRPGCHGKKTCASWPMYGLLSWVSVPTQGRMLVFRTRSVPLLLGGRLQTIDIQWLLW